jgi:hypothetical protein
LPLHPRFAGSNVDEDDGLLREIKICNMTSYGGEVKPLAELLIVKIQWPFLAQFLPDSLLGASAGNCQRALVNESGMIRTQMRSTVDQ